MHTEILNKQQTELLPLVQRFASDFYLVGGTAIALQYGHRRSIDFDLFTESHFDNRHILRVVRGYFPISVIHIDQTDQLTFFTNNVKMTFYRYDYKVPHRMRWANIITIPDALTIGAMKALALGRRAKWKDYLDLYFVLQHHSIEEIVAKANKYFGEGEFNEKLFRTQLTYHTDISYREEVEWMPGVEVAKEEILAKLIEAATE